jgi:hypothetical protein
MPPIYESPDGGQTVYVRNPGSLERELHHVSPGQMDLNNQVSQDRVWWNIRQQAETDAGLHELLERAIIYYTLKYDKKDQTSG